MLAKVIKNGPALILALTLILAVAAIPSISVAKNNPVYPEYQIPPGTLYGGGTVGIGDSQTDFGQRFVSGPTFRSKLSSKSSKTPTKSSFAFEVWNWVEGAIGALFDTNAIFPQGYSSGN